MEPIATKNRYVSLICMKTRWGSGWTLIKTLQGSSDNCEISTFKLQNHVVTMA